MQPRIHRYGFSVLAAGLWLLMMPFVFAQTTREPSKDQVNAEVGDSANIDGNSEANAEVDGNTEVDGSAEVGDDAEVSDGAGTGRSSKAGGSAEVEHNEENYRRFMELRDRGRRTSDLPTNAYQPGSQKLDQLPESSQKHLRNELREVIVKEGEWQQGDENKRYAYVPSEAAKGDRDLQLQEAEAWDELVEKYQEREAQIHSNAVRSEAARKAASTALVSGDSENSQSGSQSGGQQGSEGQTMGSQGQDGQSGQSGQAGESGQSGQASQQNASESSKDHTQDSYSPASEAAQQAETRDAGVSENALQFLTRSQSAGQSGSQQQTGQGSRQDSRQDSQQSAQQGSQQGSQQSAQQGSQQGSPQSAQQDSPQGSQPSAQQNSQQDSLISTQQDSQQASDSEQSTESEQSSESNAEKNAAETIVQQSSKVPNEPPPPATPVATDADEVSKAGTTQNALEALSRGTQTAPPADTLSIEDLSNAKGVVEENPPDSD